MAFKKPKYEVNDVVMFINRGSYDLSNQICDKCNGTRRQEHSFYDSSNNLQTIQSKCESCETGVVSKDKVSGRNKSFGVITKVYSSIDGKVLYDISLNRFSNVKVSKKIDSITKLALKSHRQPQFDLLISYDYHEFCYQVNENDIIASSKKYRTKFNNYQQIQYTYFFEIGDIVYLKKQYLFRDKDSNCSFCNNTGYVMDLNSHKIECPKHTPQTYKKQSAVKFGTIYNISLITTLEEDMTVSQNYSVEVFDKIGLNNEKIEKIELEEFKNREKWSYSLYENRKKDEVFTRDLNEIFLEDN